MHALIVGERGVGKSTLIRRVLKELNRTISGYETKKEDALADEINGTPVYIYEADKVHLQREDNLLGFCKDWKVTVIQDAFDRGAEKLINAAQRGQVIKLDEIGFMEAKSEAFCRVILSLLDGGIPVIAAVKTKEIPFLETVRSHPNAQCFHITVDNRDTLYFEVLEFMKAQLEGS